MQTKVIDARNFLRGESLNDNIASAGFSPDSYGLNLNYERGALHFCPDEGQFTSTTTSGDGIASVNDPIDLGLDAVMITDNGSIYTLDGTNSVLKTQDTSKTYIYGTTDMVFYRNELFITSENDIGMFSGASLSGSYDPDWWSAAQGKPLLGTGVRHPMEVVEGLLYIADGSNIHVWDGAAATGTTNAITLPTDVNITSLRKHPDGRHLIAFAGATQNYSHTLAGGGAIYVIDTLTFEFVREIDQTAQVEGSILAGGVVYVTFGNKFGYFNGSGLEELRTLTVSNVYSHRLAKFGDDIMIADGESILQYGDLGAGRVFWKPAQFGGLAITNIIEYQNNKIIITKDGGGSTNILRTIDFSTAGTKGRFISDVLSLGGDVWIRRVEIEHTETVTGNYDFRLLFAEHGNDITEYRIFTYADNPNIRKARIDLNIRTSIFRLGLSTTFAAAIFGFRKITIYYESAE